MKALAISLLIMIAVGLAAEEFELVVASIEFWFDLHKLLIMMFGLAMGLLFWVKQKEKE